MIFDKAGENIFDQQRVVGKPQRRVDGPLKVTGSATYAYEQQIGQKLPYGYIVGAEIAYGKITGKDKSKARNSKGVIDIITYQNVPEVGVGRFSLPKHWAVHISSIITTQLQSWWQVLLNRQEPLPTD